MWKLTIGSLDNCLALMYKELPAAEAIHKALGSGEAAGVYNRGFRSPNLPVNNMIAYLEGRKTVVEF